MRRATKGGTTPAPKSKAADRLFRAVLAQQGLPQPEAETMFHPTRKWRWDYAWPSHRVALEVQGGVWTGGRHGRGSGIVKDMEKYTAGAVLGWRLLLVEPKFLPTLQTAGLIRRALAGPDRATDSPSGGHDSGPSNLST